MIHEKTPRTGLSSTFFPFIPKGKGQRAVLFLKIAKHTICPIK